MRIVAPLSFALLLAGCALGRESLALRDVALDPAVVPAGLAGMDAQLEVGVPRAAAPLDDVRIALRDDAGVYAVMPGVRWREPAPQLVQSLLVEALERCTCLAGIARTGAAARPDFLLAGELRELALDDGDADAHAVARLSLSLVRARDGRVVATKIVEQRVALAARSDAAGISALAAAANAVAGATVEWLHAALATETQRSKPP